MSRHLTWLVLVASGVALGLLTAPQAQDTRGANSSVHRLIGDDPDLTAIDGGFLMVWSEARRTGFLDLKGAALWPDGGIGTPFDVSTEPLAQQSPAVACQPGVCLVVWVDPSDGPRALRLTEQGIRLDATTLALQPGTIASSIDVAAPVAASGDTDFLVVWTSGGEVRQRLVPLSGQPRAMGTIASFPNYEGSVRVAAGPSGFLVAWEDIPPVLANSLYVQTVSNSAALVGARRLIATGDFVAPAVAGGTADYLVVWASTVSGTYRGPLMYSRVQPIGPFTPPATITTDDCGRFNDVVFDGMGFVVASKCFGLTDIELRTYRVLTISGPAQLVDTTYNLNRTALATNGTMAIAVSTDDRGLAGLELTIHPLTPTGAAAGPLRALPPAPQVHSTPRLAANPAGFLTVWNDDTASLDGGSVDVVAVLSDPLAAPLHMISIATGPEIQTTLGAGSDSQTFWTAWQQTSSRYGTDTIFARAVDFTGLPGPAIPLTTNVCCVSDVTFVDVGPVTWALFSGYAAGNFGFGLRLTADAGRLDPLDHRLMNGTVKLTGAWAANSQTLLLVWQNAGDVLTRRFDANGQPRDTLTTTLATGYPQFHSVVSNGRDFLIVWSDVNETFYARRVDGVTGLPLGTAVTLHGCCDVPNAELTELSSPAVGWDGTNWRVIYPRISRDAGLDLWTLEFDADGGQTTQTRLTSAPGDEYLPQLALASPGRLGMAKLATDETAGAVRVELQVFASVPPGQRCFGTAECQVGQCINNACCDVDAGPCGLDAGASDASVDAGTADGGSSADGGGSDAGAGDGGAGLPDAGSVDAGAANDGGAPDGGAADAGAADGGAPDAGDADSGIDVSIDAGGDAGVPRHRDYNVSCSCTTFEPTLVLATLALMLWRPRLRSRWQPSLRR